VLRFTGDERDETRGKMLLSGVGVAVGVPLVYCME
jgi:hypothetical protein